jgi:hypothetical protein
VQDTGEKIDETGRRSDAAAQRLEGVRKTLGTIGVGMVAVGTAMVVSGHKLSQAEIQLRRAIENQGKSLADYQEEIDATVRRQEKFGHTSADTKNALAKLTFALKDPQKALEAMALVSDVAATKNQSLSEAALLVTRAYGGNAKVLKQFGIDIKEGKELQQAAEKATKDHAQAVENLMEAEQRLSDLREVLAEKDKLTVSDKHALRDATQGVADAQKRVEETAIAEKTATDNAAGALKSKQQAVDELGQRLRGVAEDEAETFVGKLDAIKSRLEGITGELGQKYGPAFLTFGTVLTTVTGFGSDLAAVLDTKVGASLLNLAKDGGPIALAVAAGVGLGVAIHSLVEKHFPEFNDVLEDFGGWIYDKLIPALEDWGGKLYDIWNWGNKIAEQRRLEEAGRKQNGGGQPQGWGRLARPFQHGGIVTRPTLALIGEAGPEAVIPLQKGASMASGMTINITVQGSLVQQQDLGRFLQTALLEWQRSNGSLRFA